MFLAKLSINRPILTSMGILVLLLFGMLSFNGFFGLVPDKGLKLNQMPDVQIPMINIQTIYPGAGPKEIETQITKKIEDAVATVSEIEYIESYSLDAISIITVKFLLSKDVDIANQELKDKVDQIINDLPTDAKKPTVQKLDLKAEPIIDIVLSGDKTPMELFDIADKTLKDRFAQIKGVSKVDIKGGREREIQVNFDNKDVYENMVSLPQMLQVMKAYNMDLPGGYFDIQGQEYTVRLKGKFNSTKEMAEVEVPTAFGPKKLRQIAKVTDGGKKVRERSIYFNNIKKIRDENVVRLSIIKSSDGNVVKVAEAVKASMDDIRKAIPEGCKIEIVNDNSDFIRSTVADTLSNIYLGIAFTALVLFVFLHNIRSTIIIILSMPTSIVATFMLMDMAGYSLNVMSLMGISVSVGVLVANSVVVLENIFRHKSLGADKKQSAFKGTSEIAVAVLASTLTNIAVFIPIGTMGSIVGKFLAQLAFTAAFATIMSTIISFTLTPMLASMILPDKTKESTIGNFIESILKYLEDLYQRILVVFLRNRWIAAIVSIIVPIAILIFTVMEFGSKIGGEFIPAGDAGRLQVIVELPVGYNLNSSQDLMEEIESRIAKHDEVLHILTNIGTDGKLERGTNLGKIDVYLVDAKFREIGLQDMISTISYELSDLPNATIKVAALESAGGGGPPLEFVLLGQDLDKLEELREQIYNSTKTIPGLTSYDHSSRTGKPEITVIPKRNKLIEAGLTVADIAMTLRSSIEGMESSKYKERGNEYDIKISLDDASVKTPEDVGNITVISKQGAFRLSQVADITFTSGFSKIVHRDKYTAVKFSGYNEPEMPTGTIMAEIDKRIAEIELPSGYRTEWTGNAKMQEEMGPDFALAAVMAILLTIILLAAILESLNQPFFIIYTFVLALIGVFSFMYFTGVRFGITSFMGIIMLIGIVVNNAILILDYTNQLIREDGMSVKDALIKAAPTKLKPILMSTLAIILGMMPMALGVGDAGSEMRIPLGVVSIGGLAVSTFMTIFVIPALTFFFDWNLKAKFAKLLKKA